MLEGIMNVAEHGPARYHPHWRSGEELRIARLCYDHLAGQVAVGIADVLAERGHIALTEDGGEVSEDGASFLGRIGVDLGKLVKQRRAFCRPCLDWSMRRPHIAGALGAALLERFLDLAWLESRKDSRAVAVTPVGRRELTALFGNDLLERP